MVNALLARQRRRLLELSQAEVARRIGVDRRTVIAWEKGEMQPSLENAVAWAKAIDLAFTELVTDPEVQVGMEVAGARPASAGDPGAGNFPDAPATPPQSRWSA